MSESRRECTFCEGSGLALDGERDCDACGGSGRWEDAALALIQEAAPLLMARDNPYRKSGAVLDLLALVPPRRRVQKSA